MTTMPAAVDALVDVCRAALPDDRVDDGWTVDPYEVNADGVTAGVSVGWDESGPSIEADLDREQSDGMGSDLETYRIYSTLFVAWGNAEAPPLRTECFNRYAAIKAELRSRRPLTPGVLRARVMAVDYELAPIENGWEGRLRWAVEVTAFDRD
jgi:hypothetical protein